MANKDDQTIDIFPKAEPVQRHRRARKPVESYDLQAAFDEIDDLADVILDSDKPNFTAIMQGIAKKMEAKGFLGVRRENGDSDGESNKSIQLEIIGVKASNSNT